MQVMVMHWLYCGYKDKAKIALDSLKISLWFNQLM